MQRIIIKSIDLWKLTELTRQSFLRVFGLSVHTCKFTPTCSHYTKQAVIKYGVIKGLILGFKRVLKCNPWSKSVYDPLH